MKIDINIIKILDLVDRYGSISRAADVLDKVPSGLSHNIAKIEKRLKTRLLLPEGRSVKLSAVGLALLEDGRKVLNSLERIERKVINFESGIEEEFFIGIETSIATSPALQLMARYCQKNSKASVNLIESSMSKLNINLISRKIHFAIGTNFDKASGNKNITTKLLMNSQMSLVISPKHKFYQTIIENKDQLDCYPWDKIFCVTLQNHDLMLYPQELRKHINFTTIVPDVKSQLEAISLGVGVGLVPENSLTDYGDSIKILTSNPSWIITYHAAWNTMRMEKSLRWFIRQLENIYTRTALVSNKDIITTVGSD